MVEQEPQTWAWLERILPTFFVAGGTFIATMIGFKASMTEKNKTHDKEMESVQKDITRLEITKADSEALKSIWAEIKRIDVAKAEKDVVNMMIQQLQSIDNKLMQVLSRLPER